MFVLFVAGDLSAPAVSAVSTSELGRSLYDAFQAVSRAENAGGDVSELVKILAQAVRLMEVGGENNLVIAQDYIASVRSVAGVIENRGLTSVRINLITNVTVTLLLALLMVFVWLFGSDVFWSYWIKMKKGWIVKEK